MARYANPVSSRISSKSIFQENWLGWKDSNLRMPVPKTGALPLGYTPTPWERCIAMSLDLRKCSRGRCPSPLPRFSPDGFGGLPGRGEALHEWHLQNGTAGSIGRTPGELEPTVREVRGRATPVGDTACSLVRKARPQETTTAFGLRFDQSSDSIEPASGRPVSLRFFMGFKKSGSAEAKLLREEVSFAK